MNIMIFVRGLGSAVVASASIALTPSQAKADEPFVGQLILGGQNFCPRGFAPADGQLLPIASNQALFSLFGTFYGGDGRSTFGLPDLRGRVPINDGARPGGANRNIGTPGGIEETIITSANMPPHTHSFAVPATIEFADKRGPGNKMPGRLPQDTQGIYQDPPADAGDLRPMAPGTTANAGSSVPATTVSPYVTMKWCVALLGIYPSRN